MHFWSAHLLHSKQTTGGQEEPMAESRERDGIALATNQVATVNPGLLTWISIIQLTIPLQFLE